MGNRYEVWGRTFTPRYPGQAAVWHYAEVYQGELLIVALWKAFRARRSYGCVKLEMR